MGIVVNNETSSTKLTPRIPSVLHPLILDYTLRLEREIPGFVTAFYLTGSIALDSFNPRFSDIDFISILSRRATPGDMDSILKIHHVVEGQSPKWKMEGIYLQAGDLGRLEKDVEPYPSYHDGKLRWSRGYEVNPVTWWILKERGVAVIGPDPQELPIALDIDRLLGWMGENLNTYWAGWTRWPRARLVLLSDFGIQWTVLGVLRQFYTFREKAIVAKTQAGEYALACLPERWHWLIREAIALREGSPRPPSRPGLFRSVEAVRFLKYIILTCNCSFSRRPDVG